MGRLVGLVMTMTMLVGCSLTIVEMHPKPNVAFTASTEKTLKLSIANEITNDFHIPSKNGIMGADIKSYRTSLNNGFISGYRDYFHITDGAVPTDLTVEITRADLELTAAAVSGAGGVVAASAQITYKAKLVDNTGKVIKVAADTVSSKKSVVQRWEITDCVASAVETMYEAISKQLF